MVIDSEKKVVQKNKALMKANAELDRFVYSASHDLRAPLSSILGLVQIYHFTTEEEKRKEIIDYIEARALKMDDFIKEILDYAKNTRTEVKKSSIDLREIVQEVLDNFRFINGFQKIRVSIEGAPCVAQTDPDRLKVILSNFLSNAIKYRDADKNDPFIRIIIGKENSSFSITVQDNGVGIRPDHQPKVFDMFYRANDSVEGSGLGLYIAKETAERLHGKIEMTSEFGQGTSFTVSLPMAL
jgi:signal transduction histidine kinase